MSIFGKKKERVYLRRKSLLLHSYQIWGLGLTAVSLLIYSLSLTPEEKDNTTKTLRA